MSNKFTFNPQTGDLSAEKYIKATLDYKCECGQEFEITLDWPENLTTTGKLNITNIKCPSCGKDVSLPKAKYYVENSKVVSEPVEEKE